MVPNGTQSALSLPQRGPFGTTQRKGKHGEGRELTPVWGSGGGWLVSYVVIHRLEGGSDRGDIDRLLQGGVLFRHRNRLFSCALKTLGGAVDILPAGK